MNIIKITFNLTLFLIVIPACSYNRTLNEKDLYTTLSKIDLLQLDSDNNKQWSLKANTARLNNNKNLLLADKPFITLYQDNI